MNLPFEQRIGVVLQPGGTTILVLEDQTNSPVYNTVVMIYNWQMNVLLNTQVLTYSLDLKIDLGSESIDPVDSGSITTHIIVNSHLPVLQMATVPLLAGQFGSKLFHHILTLSNNDPLNTLPVNLIIQGMICDTVVWPKPCPLPHTPKVPPAIDPKPQHLNPRSPEEPFKIG